MEIKLNDRKWLEGLVSQKTNTIALVEKNPISDVDIKEIISRLDRIENKKKKIIAKITRDSLGRMESIIIEK